MTGNLNTTSPGATRQSGDGYGSFFAAIDGELADAGAKIINNSWGGLYWSGPTTSLRAVPATRARA